MIGKYRRWRQQRRMNKVKQGDGHSLKRYRFWELFSRSLFFIEIDENDGSTNVYAVDVNYFSEKSTAELYRNGKHIATSKLPAAFPVGQGIIEVATTTYGLKRMHYVLDSGNEQMLSPYARSMEGLRMRFDARFPEASKIIQKAAVIILLLSLILGIPQLAALISEIPYIQERFGTFESPIVLPNWANLALIIAGAAAAIERAITLRYHWLIDMETSWWDS